MCDWLAIETPRELTPREVAIRALGPAARSDIVGATDEGLAWRIGFNPKLRTVEILAVRVDGQHIDHAVEEIDAWVLKEHPEVTPLLARRLAYVLGDMAAQRMRAALLPKVASALERIANPWNAAAPSGPSSGCPA